MTFLNGVVLDARAAAQTDRRAVRRDRRDRRGAHRPARRRRVGARRQHPVPVGQADGQPPRRDAQPDGRRVARPAQARHRHAHAVHALHRHRAHRARGGRAFPSPRTSTGSSRSRWTAPASCYTLDDAKAQEQHTVQYFEFAGSRAIYKDGWWACAKLDRIPWDFSPDTMKRFAPGAYDPEKDNVGAVLPARTTSPRRTTSRPSIRTSSRSSRSCSGRRPSATACCR